MAVNTALGNVLIIALVILTNVRLTLPTFEKNSALRSTGKH